MHRSSLRTLAVAMTLLVAFVVPLQAWAQASVSIEDGNVVLQRGDQRTQLTHAGKDLEAAISRDGGQIAFVRSTPDVTVSTGSGPAEAREIWIADTADLSPTRLLTGYSAGDVRDLVAGIRHLQFSPDGRYLFFLSAAWATSDALHRIDLSTREERFITSANRYAVLESGEFAESLLVNKHRYRSSGGSYDPSFIVTFDGIELAPAPARELRRVWPEEDDGSDAP
jgi:dipeptidyl aminopeptidase/acylaminoacyl peptidase